MSKMQVNYDGKEIVLNGQLYHYGKQGYAKKAHVIEFWEQESLNMEITHHNETPDGKTAYWLKSYGLDSWNIQI